MDKSEDIVNSELNKDASGCANAETPTPTSSPAREKEANEVSPMEIEQDEETTRTRELNEEELLEEREGEQNSTSQQNQSPIADDLIEENENIEKMDVDENSKEETNESAKENKDETTKEDNIESGVVLLVSSEEVVTSRNESPIDENSINSFVNQDENSKNSNLNQDENTSLVNQDENSKNSNINQDENTNDLSSNKEPENSRDNLEENSKTSTNERRTKPSSEASDEETRSQAENDQRQEDEEDFQMSVNPESIMNMCSTQLVEDPGTDLTTEFVQVQLMDDDASDSNSLQQSSETNNKALSSKKTTSQIDPLLNSSVLVEIRTLDNSASETIIGDDDDEEESNSHLKNIELVNKEDEGMCIVPDAMPAIISIEDRQTAEDEPTIIVSEDKNTSETLEETSSNKIKIKSIAQEPKQKSKTKDKSNRCHMCRETKQSRFMIRVGNETRHLCDKACVDKFKKSVSKQQSFGSTMDFISQKDPEPKVPLTQPLPRSCACCHKEIILDNKNIYICWETLEFCAQHCLENYQKQLGSDCSNCKGPVCEISLGKYCVRFGSDVNQFCSSMCLDEFKKGLKVCCYCQKDISKNKDGFLAPIGDKGQFKEFCSQNCMEEYERMSSNLPPTEIINDCSVCNKKKTRIYKEILDKDKTHMLCSEPCFAAFKFVNPIVIDKCVMCRKCFNRENTNDYKVCFNKNVQLFCSKTCMNVFILAYRKIICCDWCKVKKYNFDMIHYERGTQKMFLCSLNCIKLYSVSISACTSERMECHNCHLISPANFHLAMSDATLRNFCSYNCVQYFQTEFNRQIMPSNLIQQGEPRPLGVPKTIHTPKDISISSTGTLTLEKSAEESQNIAEQNIRLEREYRHLNNENQLSEETSILKNRLNSYYEKKSSTNNFQEFTYDPLKSLVKMNKGHQPANEDFQVDPSQTDSSRLSRDNQAETLNKQIVIIKPEAPKRRRNVATMCHPNSFVAETQTTSSSTSSTCDASTQTDGDKYKLNFPIPVPIPIYVPCPFFMFSLPYPHPFPFPLPLPVPIFLPTTRKSYKAITEDIKRILKNTPSDPCEAELIKMAEAVASEKETNTSDTEDDDNDNDIVHDEIVNYESEHEDNVPGEIVNYESEHDDNVQEEEIVNYESEHDDNVQEEEIVNYESEHDDNVQEEIVPEDNNQENSDPDENDQEESDQVENDQEESDQNQFVMDESNSSENVNEDTEEQLSDEKPNYRPVEEEDSDTMMNDLIENAPASAIDQSIETAEEIYSKEDETTDISIDNISPRSAARRGRSSRRNKPEDTRESTPEESNNLTQINIKNEQFDDKIFHKYSLGVAAFNLWINEKNQQLANSSTKSFKSELLQMRADELNYLLCLFIKEARNQIGLEFTPDTIYYLCLGIQQYLFESGRIDNIFTDEYFEQFSDDLDILAQNFICTFENSDQVETRLEEEFLWESKQLGAYSPSILLNTLIYFNTKYFNLTTVEEHMKLSFSKIMKHWKKPMTQIQMLATKTKNSQNILLRYYPGEEDNYEDRKKRIYEQHENEQNPMRCPVRLYEFYLSKCPESAKSRGHENFYLMPERSCVPESPVWYSTEALAKEPLVKMLNRIKMFKEINDAIIKNNE